MKNTGYIIKKTRINYGIKQQVLAKGICSISYLSKIENNLVVPNQEIISLLLKKLNLNIIHQSEKQEYIILEDMEIKYEQAVNYRDVKYIQSILNEIESSNIVIKDDSLYITFQLIKARMLLIVGNIEKFDFLNNFIDSSSQKLTNYQQYLFNLNKSLRHYHIKDYSNSLKYVLRAYKYSEIISLKKWEKADLNNILSLCYYSSDFIYNSIKFSKKALDSYLDLLLFERVINCYIELGKSFTTLQMFQDAEENFKSAFYLAEHQKLSHFNRIIYWNLGNLNSLQSKNIEAINYFSKSIENSSGQEYELLALHGIIKEYFKIGDTEKSLKWCKRGLVLTLENAKYDQSFYYHFKIFKEKIEGSSSYITIIREAIIFFEKNNDYKNVIKYSTLLADFCFSIRKYKEAGLYYQLAQTSQLKLWKRLSWDDF